MLLAYNFILQSPRSMRVVEAANKTCEIVIAKLIRLQRHRQRKIVTNAFATLQRNSERVIRKNICDCNDCGAHHCSPSITRKRARAHGRIEFGERAWTPGAYFPAWLTVVLGPVYNFHLRRSPSRRIFQNSVETILCSSERNVHEFIDDIEQIFATDNFEAVSRGEETNGEKTHALFDEFPMSSVSASKGCTICEKKFHGLTL